VTVACREHGLMIYPSHILAACALVTRPDMKVLLVRTEARGWVLPGGQIEEGESLIDGLQREILEEAGIEACIGPLVGVCSNITPPAKVVFSFLAEWLVGDIRPSNETPEVRWVPRSSIFDLVAHEADQDRIRDMLEFQGVATYRVISTRPYLVHSERTLTEPQSNSALQPTSPFGRRSLAPAALGRGPTTAPVTTRGRSHETARS
jgi:8-oxo-dGTP diphosphatase